MARKSPTEWVELQPGSASFVFDEHIVGQLLIDAKVRLASNGMTLASASDELNRATYWLRMHQVYSELPTPAASRAALKQILNHATILRALLRVVDDDGLDGAGANPRVVDGIAYLLIHEMRGAMEERYGELAERSGEARTFEEVFGASGPGPALAVLAELLGVVVTAAQRNMGDDPPARSVKGPSPLMRFVWDASTVYIKLTGKTQLPVSRGTNKRASGPLIRFLQACCAEIGEEAKPETLASWVQSYRGQQEAEVSSDG